jgi:hypothetical protein
VDAAQHSLGQGPCITAAAEQRTIRSGSLGEDPAWPRFGPRAAGLGVHSALALLPTVSNVALGALNFYAHARDAAFSMQNARAVFQAREVAGQLQAALAHREVIDLRSGSS